MEKVYILREETTKCYDNRKKSYIFVTVNDAKTHR